MKIYVYIIHFSYNIKGGAEYLSLLMYKALSTLYNTKIVTLSHIDVSSLKKLYNIKINENDIIHLKTIKESDFINTNQRFRLIRYLNYVKKLYQDTKHIIENGISIDTYTNLLTPSVDINYVHFPYIYYEIFLKNASNDNLYRKIIKLFMKKNFYKSKMIITNSIWTSRIIYKIFNKYPLILYPSIYMNSNSLYKNNYYNKENSIITVSRISPEKKIEEIFKVAKQLNEYKFYIIGTLSNRHKKYYKKLVSRKPQNVSILINLDRNELFKLYEVSKYYLHPPYREHFGISILEALSFLTIPFAFYDSGACIDILSNIDPKLCYNNLEEIVSFIKKTDYEDYVNSKKKYIITLLKKFSFEEFKNKIVDLIKNIEHIRFK